MKRNFELAPLMLLIAFTLKLLILNTWSYQEAVVLLGLAGISALFHIKAKNEQLEEVRVVLKEQAKDIEYLRNQNEAVKTSISGLKLANASKNMPRF